MTETQHRCEVCAQRVVIHLSDEGTGFYLPLERCATLNEAAVKILVLAALEKQPEAHAALMFAAERVRALKDTNPFTQAECGEIPNNLEAMRKNTHKEQE